MVIVAPEAVVNVRDYGALGTGLVDETAAILQAIRENIGFNPGQIIYLPAGIYLVSDRLAWRDLAGTWHAHLTFQGDGWDNTVIKLMDFAPGFDNPASPKAVIFTASEGRTSGPVDWVGLGEGNEAFRNDIFDLSVETGVGNPGAIGIDYLASNIGAIRNVGIRSGDGQGIAGLWMARRWPGPCFIKNVAIEGFNYGIRIGHAQYSVTFERLTLTNQKVAGIRNDDNVLTIHDLVSANSVPVIQNMASRGQITLLDGSFTGGSPAVSAIENQAGELVARNVAALGYRSAISDIGVVIPGNTVSEFVSSPVLSLFPSPLKSLGLPVQETPELPHDSLADSVSVADFGAVHNDRTRDSLAAFQAAIDSGALTVYAPPGGKYLFSNTFRLRGNIQRLDLMGCWLGFTQVNSFDGVKPLIRLEPGTQPVVVIERIGSLWDVGATTVPGTGIEHASPATLVIRDGGGACRTLPGSGPLFLENVSTNTMSFKSQNVWGRQLDAEGGAPANPPYIRNDGGKLWILGLKTERPNQVMETTGGGQTELLGGLLMPIEPVPATLPAFVNVESSQTLTYATGGPQDYQVQVRETRGGVVRELLKADVLPRGGASAVPLYVGYGEGDGPPPPPPPPGKSSGGAIVLVGILAAIIAVASHKE